MNKKILLYVLMAPVLITVAVDAQQQNIYEEIDTTAFSRINVSLVEYLNTTNSTNQTVTTNYTHIFPVSCLLPDNLSAPGICAVDITLSDGETFVREDQSCNLNIRAPRCEEEVELEDYEIRFRIYTEDDVIVIHSQEDNETREFPKDDSFNYETEFTIQCPEGAGRDELDINISDDEFAIFFAEPLKNYGISLSELSSDFIEQVNEKDTQIGQLTESNRNLAAQNAELNERNGGLQEKAELYENELEEKEECREDLLVAQEKLEGSGFYSFLFWGLLVVYLITIFVWRTLRAVEKIGRTK